MKNPHFTSRLKASPKARKRLIAGCTIAVTIGVASCGLLAWHEQPSFCNAFCHAPMDPYVETYDQTYGSPGVDKWGNEVSDASSMLAVSHKEQGMNCLSCHVPTLQEQASEGIEWLSTGFNVPTPLAERDCDDLTRPRTVEEDAACLNESCHNYTREELAYLPAVRDMKYNPHAAQHNEMAGASVQTSCSDCHKSHRASVMYCTKCHVDADVPSGWITYRQDRELRQELHQQVEEN